MTTGPTPSIHESPTLDLRANPDLDRYELWDDQQFIGFLGVEILEDETVDVQHTIVAEAFGRQGYARTLVTFVFDQFREQGVKIRPTCTYVLDYLQRFPQYQDLVADTPDPRNQE
ncbi:MAG: N-acetyltransferase [Kocuria sp.]|nr:N-acetyltransferase [Kocuria sp.]